MWLLMEWTQAHLHKLIKHVLIYYIKSIIIYDVDFVIFLCVHHSSRSKGMVEIYVYVCMFGELGAGLKQEYANTLHCNGMAKKCIAFGWITNRLILSVLWKKNCMYWIASMYELHGEQSRRGQDSKALQEGERER